MSTVPTSLDVKWDQFCVDKDIAHLFLIKPTVAQEFARAVCQQLQAEFAAEMSKCITALALIQEAKTLAEAVGLAKDAALTGHMFDLSGRNKDKAENTKDNPKSWIAWRREAEEARRALTTAHEVFAVESDRLGKEILRLTSQLPAAST